MNKTNYNTKVRYTAKTPRRIPSIMKDYFSYNRQTGDITWIKKLCDGISIGRTAGYVGYCGYIRISFKRLSYKGHRIAWFLYYNEQPDVIDHIDGNKSNNKIDNLRSCSHSENARNHKIGINNKSGVSGGLILILITNRHTWVCLRKKKML